METEQESSETMRGEIIRSEIARRSARIYLPLALGAALLFWLAASLDGGYPAVARIGGSAWVGLLTLIISMPLVTSRVKKMVSHLQMAIFR